MVVSDHWGGYWLCNDVSKIIRHDGKIKLAREKIILVFNLIGLSFVNPTSRQMAPNPGQHQGQHHACCPNPH